MSIRWILYLFLGLVFSGISQDTKITITFNELDDFLRKNSPKLITIENDYLLNEKYRQLSLQPVNPEIEYEVEHLSNDLDSETEKTLLIQKSFELPWLFLKRRQYWRNYKMASDALKLESQRNFFAEMKSGYTTLKLLNNQSRILSEIQTVLQNISKTAKSQLEEGAISGFEQRLIEMSLLKRERTILELMERRLTIETDWKSKAGIKFEYLLDLETEVVFKDIKFPEQLETDNISQDNPGLLFRQYMQHALQNSVEIEKWAFIPEITLGGGYKEISQGYKGVIFNISMPLPLLNLNRIQKDEKLLQFFRFKNETVLYQQKLSGKIYALKRIILAHRKLLLNSQAVQGQNKNNLDQIVSSYNEGWISLTDMLNAIEIYYEFVNSYNENLENYYRHIFELEAITGETQIEL